MLEIPLEHVAIPVQNIPTTFNLVNQPGIVSQNMTSEQSPQIPT